MTGRRRCGQLEPARHGEHGEHGVKEPRMPEGANVEIAHSLTEQEHGHGSDRHDGWHRVLEILEVALLAVVAVATAWSGFQAAKWDGRQSVLYGRSSHDRFEAGSETTTGDQRLAADAANFTAWLQAHAAGNTDLETLLSKRFTPDFKVAFDAWLQTDPFVNSAAPAGPALMPQYKNPDLQNAAALNAKASAAFDAGTEARETGEKYVRNTVLFAMVLFLVAIAQRMKDRTLRSGVNVIAVILAGYAIVSIAGLPRL
jgi:NADH:ubiquinone oxidoreductase subunit 3 (subunit A)